MVNDERYEIRKRAQKFAVEIINMVRSFPRDPSSRVIGNQIIRSSTSISANIVEAQSAISRKEFTYSMNVAKKEARETLNWLEIINDANLNKNFGTTIYKECNELVSILTSIVKKLQNVNRVS